MKSESTQIVVLELDRKLKMETKNLAQLAWSEILLEYYFTFGIIEWSNDSENIRNHVVSKKKKENTYCKHCQ